MAKGLAGRPRPNPHRLDPPLAARPPPRLDRERRERARDLEWLDELAPAGVQLLFFGGKGGVGKTTCSAAVALALAERRPEARVLLLSTDPAHSLADVLEVPLGDDERAVPALPRGCAPGSWTPGAPSRAWRDRAPGRASSEAAAARFDAQDGGGVQDLLDLTPPGIDELIAVSSLLDAVFDRGAEPAYDLVVVDTAPTGHALRLLEMPELALSWDHYLLSLLLKYREAVGLGDLAAELVELSRSLKRLEALLRDPARARFVAVTRAAELPRRETVRLLRSLRAARDRGAGGRSSTPCRLPAAPAAAAPPERPERCARISGGWGSTGALS